MKVCITYKNGNLDINDVSVNQKVRDGYQKLKDTFRSLYAKAEKTAEETKEVRVEGNLEFKINRK